MYFKNHLLTFSVLLIYCNNFCESGIHQTYDNTLLRFISSDTESVLVENDETRLISLYKDKTWRSDEKGCNCTNGKCQNVCAEWKDGACRQTKKACVCYPEFGQKDDSTCIYCNCGEGFSCTIDHTRTGDMRKCICPKGYYDNNGKCIPLCSENRPCLNGGNCRHGRCDCLSSSHGPFCEYSEFCATRCRPSLIMECVFNPKEFAFECLCKNRSLVLDFQEWVCKPCPCGEGTCKPDNLYSMCNCNPGYKEFQKQCKKCDCGPDHDCEILPSGEKSCKCRDGSFSREGTCLPCNCGHENATCSLDTIGRKVCICPEDYEDVFGFCERKKVNCTCHLPTATCVETINGFDCVCKDGYERKNETELNLEDPCIDINECFDEKTCPTYSNQKCVNFPGSYMCQCQRGYQPISGVTDGRNIACKKYKSSWLPAGISLTVILVMAFIIVGVFVFIKKREILTPTSRLQVQFTK